MSGPCEELDPEVISQTKLYYYELLNGLSESYNNFHRFIYQFLCIIGVIANICFVIVLLRPTMRKNPFNLFLIAIAICDLSLMASYFIYKQVEMCHPWYFTFFWIVYTYGYAVLSVFVHSASLWMTVNMAVLRYLVLKSGSSSSRRWPRLNTYTVASVSVFIAVLLAAVGSAPNMLRYEIQDNGRLAVPSFCVEEGAKYAHLYQPGQLVNAYTLGQPAYWGCGLERFSFWTAGVLLKLVPCLLLTVFMTLLVRMLVEARERRSRLIAKKAAPPLPSQNDSSRSVGQMERTTGGGMSGGKMQAERTTAMLTIIVATFLITELPQGILVIAIGVKPQVRFAMHQLSNIIDLLSLLNSSVNFILYATMSNLFRHEFLHTFGQCCPMRLLAWLHPNKENKASPRSPNKKMEPGTLMTGLNGSSKLLKTTPQNGLTAERRHFWAVNGNQSSMRISKLAPNLANNCTTARNSLPMPFTSRVISVLKKTEECAKVEPSIKGENDHTQQKRQLLFENGTK